MYWREYKRQTQHKKREELGSTEHKTRSYTRALSTPRSTFVARNSASRIVIHFEQNEHQLSSRNYNCEKLLKRLLLSRSVISGESGDKEIEIFGVGSKVSEKHIVDHEAENKEKKHGLTKYFSFFLFYHFSVQSRRKYIKFIFSKKRNGRKDWAPKQSELLYTQNL
jgi:hypothetical protein